MSLHVFKYLYLVHVNIIAFSVTPLFVLYFVSQDAVNMPAVLHNERNEETIDDDYEVVDMDPGVREDSDSEQDYVNIDQGDSDPDYVNVETDESEQDYVNMETDDSEQDYINAAITENIIYDRQLQWRPMEDTWWNTLQIFILSTVKNGLLIHTSEANSEKTISLSHRSASDFGEKELKVSR